MRGCCSLGNPLALLAQGRAWILEARPAIRSGPQRHDVLRHTSRQNEYSNALWGQALHMVGALLTLVVLHPELHDRCSEHLHFESVQFHVLHQTLEIFVC